MTNLLPTDTTQIRLAQPGSSVALRAFAPDLRADFREVSTVNALSSTFYHAAQTRDPVEVTLNQYFNVKSGSTASLPFQLQGAETRSTAEIALPNKFVAYANTLQSAQHALESGGENRASLVDMVAGSPYLEFSPSATRAHQGMQTANVLAALSVGMREMQGEGHNMGSTRLHAMDAKYIHAAVGQGYGALQDDPLLGVAALDALVKTGLVSPKSPEGQYAQQVSRIYDAQAPGAKQLDAYRDVHAFVTQMGDAGPTHLAPVQSWTPPKTGMAYTA